MTRRNHRHRSSRLRLVGGQNNPSSASNRVIAADELAQIGDAVADIFDGADDSQLAMHIFSAEDMSMLERLRDDLPSATAEDHARLTLLTLQFYQARGRTNLV